MADMTNATKVTIDETPVGRTDPERARKRRDPIVSLLKEIDESKIQALIITQPRESPEEVKAKRRIREEQHAYQRRQSIISNLSRLGYW